MDEAGLTYAAKAEKSLSANELTGFFYGFTASLKLLMKRAQSL
ncbi:hypothetical protein BGLY_4367 [Bacillus glycinifermentans]|nr:hypothetical protein BGLY_4367 [Bacillus glycinifermentans]